jgi:LacI family transcriptional regulator
MCAVTIRKVAEEAGVSVSSVSRILRGVANYSYDLETQNRVRETASRLGYQANAAASLLRSQKKILVGVVTRLSVFPYENQLLLAVRDELRAQGYEPVLLEPSQLSPSSESPTFPSLEMLAGIISLYVPVGEETAKLYENMVKRLPIVTLYPAALPQYEWIYMDMAGCIELAAKHLIDLGHHSIAFARITDKTHLSHYLKAEGWAKVRQDFKLDSAPDFTIDIDVNNSIVEMATHITNRLTIMPRKPTALICGSDELALCVLGQLATQQWKLPEQLSVVGVDGIEFGSYSYPPLTTVVKPSQEIARVGVERLMRRIKDPALPAPQRELISPSLLVRGSTAPA